MPGRRKAEQLPSPYACMSPARGLGACTRRERGQVHREWTVQYCTKLEGNDIVDSVHMHVHMYMYTHVHGSVLIVGREQVATATPVALEPVLRVLRVAAPVMVTAMRAVAAAASVGRRRLIAARTAQGQ